MNTVYTIQYGEANSTRTSGTIFGVFSTLEAARAQVAQFEDVIEPTNKWIETSTNFWQNNEHDYIAIQEFKVQS